MNETHEFSIEKDILIEQYFTILRTTYESHKRVVTVELADVLAALRQNDAMRFELKKKRLCKMRFKDLFSELDAKQAANIRIARDINKKLAYLDTMYLEYQQEFYDNLCKNGTTITWRSDLFHEAKRWND